MRSFLYLSVVAVLLLASCSRVVSSGQDVNPAFRVLIWPETKLLAAVDVKQLKKSTLYQQHQDELNKLIKADQIGLDIKHDVDYLGVCSDGKRSIVFAQGNFKDVRKKNAAPENAVTFLNDRVAIAGDTESVASARALEAKGTGEVPEELAARVHSLSKDNAIWVVSRGALPMENLPLRNDTRANLGNFIGLINGVSLGVRADSGLHLAGRVSSASPEGATRIHDAFRGIIGFARLSVKDNQTDLLKVYDAFQFRKDASSVEVHADLESADVNKLLAARY